MSPARLASLLTSHHAHGLAAGAEMPHPRPNDAPHRCFSLVRSSLFPCALVCPFLVWPFFRIPSTQLGSTAARNRAWPRAFTCPCQGLPELLESFHRPTLSYTLSAMALYWLSWDAVLMSLMPSYHTLMHTYCKDSPVNCSISFSIVGSRLHGDLQFFFSLSISCEISSLVLHFASCVLRLWRMDASQA